MISGGYYIFLAECGAKIELHSNLSELLCAIYLIFGASYDRLALQLVDFLLNFHPLFIDGYFINGERSFGLLYRLLHQLC